MTTVREWLTAPLPQVERGEREAYARAEAEWQREQLGSVTGACMCNAAALYVCRMHQRTLWNAPS